MKVFFSGLLPLAKPLFVVQLVVQLVGYHCFGAKLKNWKIGNFGQFWEILGNWKIGNFGQFWEILEKFGQS